MMRTPACLLAAAAVFAACHSYRPAPIDLAAHAAEFLRRESTLGETTDGQMQAIDQRGPIDLADGIDRHEGRSLARSLHPECRLARAALAAALVEEGHAGVLEDPELSLDALRILESVPHRWIAGGGLSFTVPWSGRLGKARAVASARSVAALHAAVMTEQHATHAVDAAWVRWTGALQRTARLTEVCDHLRDLVTIADRLAAADALTRQGARVFTLELRQREHELAAQQDATARAELALLQQLGLHPTAKPRLLPDLALTPREPADRRVALLASTPRVDAALRSHSIADAELQLEVRKQWPDLQLGPRYERDEGQPRLGLGLSLPLPFFAGNDAAIARAEAARASAATAVYGAFEAATHDLTAAESHLAQAEARLQHVRTVLLPLAEAQLADGRAFASQGQLEPLLLLDAIARVHAARLLELDACVEIALATITIDECTGIVLPTDEPTGEPR